jgi:hypothetical protein
MKIAEAAGMATGVCIGLYVAYGIKVKLGINLDIGGEEHFPSVIEKSTHGIVKCVWFPNSHHCKKKFPTRWGN